MSLSKTVSLLFFCTTSLLFVKCEQSNEFFNFSIPNTETFLTKEDFENAKKHPIEEKGDIDDSAMYSKDLFEGDIANPELNVKSNYASVLAADSILRNAIKNGRNLWPNARIPYTVSAQFSAASKQLIASAVAEIQAKTCIRLVEKQAADPNYLQIQPLQGCYSYVGFIRQGAQPLSLGNGCMVKGIAVHEIMHAAGFFHEQSRNDRDEYITVNFENVRSGFEAQFNKGGNKITHLDTEYDYGSIMHYGKKSFSKNGRDTITPKRAGVQIGQRIGLSSNDAFKLNKLYNCAPTATTIAPKISTTRNTGTAKTTTLRTTTAANCFDRRRSGCSRFQRARLCRRSGSLGNFVRRSCRKTCGLCNGGATTTTATRITTTTRAPGNCRDTRRSGCRRFRRFGLCNSSRSLGNVVRRVCRKTCGLC